mmetsp:Transcript_14187/g.39018  ORF Transcript_14187/g.39018 Transcript_14187/m.39018 type:complete len:226 (+) Transcript_14187:3389-4066(+)
MARRRLVTLVTSRVVLDHPTASVIPPVFPAHVGEVVGVRRGGPRCGRIHEKVPDDLVINLDGGEVHEVLPLVISLDRAEEISDGAPGDGAHGVGLAPARLTVREHGPVHTSKRTPHDISRGLGVYLIVRGFWAEHPIGRVPSSLTRLGVCGILPGTRRILGRCVRGWPRGGCQTKLAIVLGHVPYLSLPRVSLFIARRPDPHPYPYRLLGRSLGNFGTPGGRLSC